MILLWRASLALLLIGSVLILIAVYDIQDKAQLESLQHPIRFVKDRDEIADGSSWNTSLLRARLQSDEVKYNSVKTDIHHQHLGESVPSLNNKLHRMLQEDRATEERLKRQKQQEQRKASTSSNMSASTAFSFQSLHANDDYLVYSAHYDNIHHAIKLVGFGPMSDSHDYISSLTCKVENNANRVEQRQLYVYYRISTFYPWAGQVYDSYIYACNTSFTSPTLVTITSHTHNIAVKLHILTGKITPKQQFAVCVEPLVNKYSDTKSIKHFITVNSMFGAEHFYFYVSEASAEVESLLGSLPMVTVFQWRLNHTSSKTHAFGQKASNAHCLYSNREQAEYLIYIDIDEVLVPRLCANWSSMLSRLLQNNSAQGAVVFQSKLFPKNTPGNAVGDYKTLNKLWSLSHTKTVGVFDLYKWSKVLVHTERTDIVDVHMVRRLLPGYAVINAPPSTAVVHHYRDYEHSKEQLQEDVYMLQFEKKIFQKLFSSSLIT